MRRLFILLGFCLCVSFLGTGCLGHLMRDTKRALQSDSVKRKKENISKVARVYGGVRGVRLIRPALFDKNPEVQLFTLQTLTRLAESSHAAAESVLCIAEHSKNARLKKAAVGVFRTMKHKPWYLAKRLEKLGVRLARK